MLFRELKSVVLVKERFEWFYPHEMCGKMVFSKSLVSCENGVPRELLVLRHAWELFFPVFCWQTRQCTFNKLYFQQGAESSPHYNECVHNALNEEFLQRWIEMGGYISKPSENTDLTPCYFFGHIKNLVYSEKCRNLNNNLKVGLSITDTVSTLTRAIITK